MLQNQKPLGFSLERVSKMRGDSFKRKAEDPRQTLGIRDRRQQKNTTLF